MKRKSITIAASVLLILGIIFFNNVPALAGENIEDLKKQIESLQKRVEELESKKSDKEADNNDNSRDVFGYRKGTRWDPFEDIRRMQQEMDRMFQDSFKWGSGSDKGMFRSDMYYDNEFDINEEKDKYVIEFDLTGLNNNNLDIEIKEGYMTVKGERIIEQSKEDKNNSFSSKSYATFLKTISLPSDADTEKMKSEKKGNKLIITLPKKIS